MGFAGAVIPRICDNRLNAGPDRDQCPVDSYQIVPDLCEFIDQQTLKLQEAPELIPTGEMPRTFVLTSDRYLTDQVTPGCRVKLVGIFSILNRSDSGNTMNANKQVR